MFAFVFLFAFATIVAYGYYGMASMRYFGDSRRARGIFLVFYCVAQL